MTMGGGKIKPQDLFESLSIIHKENEESSKNTTARKFFDRFSSKMTNKEAVEGLKNV